MTSPLACLSNHTYARNMFLPVDVHGCLLGHSAKLVHKLHNVISATLWLRSVLQDIEEILHHLAVIGSVLDETEGLRLDHESHQGLFISFQGVRQEVILKKLEADHLGDQLHGVCESSIGTTSLNLPTRDNICRY